MRSGSEEGSYLRIIDIYITVMVTTETFRPAKLLRCPPHDFLHETDSGEEGGAAVLLRLPPCACYSRNTHSNQSNYYDVFFLITFKPRVE